MSYTGPGPPGGSRPGCSARATTWWGNHVQAGPEGARLARSDSSYPCGATAEHPSAGATGIRKEVRESRRNTTQARETDHKVGEERVSRLDDCLGENPVRWTVLKIRSHRSVSVFLFAFLFDSIIRNCGSLTSEA